MTKDDIMEELCSRCIYLQEVVDTEEFWGAPCQRVTWECDLSCDDAEDPDCAKHDQWLKIKSAGDDTGEYKLEDAEDL
jgi:hypothetical protein